MSGERQRLIGIHAVSAALGGEAGRVHALLVASEARNPRIEPLIGAAQAAGVELRRLPRAELDRLSDGERHQDVIAEFTPANLFGERDIQQLLEAAKSPPLVLILDGVQDPHNLGACLRSAEAAGVDFVVMPKDKSSPVTPVV
ncbi:MAG TPA: RNA methyltransferase substrate-binding domain-containing protein, partial [Burkholderiales bacterium]|nr:RNA methyltransferase substrate-binding domain-containing protein [Burkholderiales bacterium]